MQNRKLKQTNNYPSKTPLNFFLNKKLDLDNSDYNMNFDDKNGISTLKFLNKKEMVGTSFNYLKLILCN